MHGRRRDSYGDGDLDVPNKSGQNGPWIHRQMNGQKQRADRPDDRPAGAISDVGRADADPEQLSAGALRSEEVGGDDESEEGDEATESAVSSIVTKVSVRTSDDDDDDRDRDREPMEQFNGMQSRLGLRPKSVSRVEGSAVSDVVAHRVQSCDRAAGPNEPTPWVEQASGYLARD